MEEETATPHLALVRAMCGLLLFTSEDIEDRFLATLLAENLSSLAEVPFQFKEELLAKKDIVAETFGAFRLAFEESDFKERLTHQLLVLKSIYAKAEKDLSDVEKVVSGMNSELCDLKQKRERAFRNGWNEIKERVFLKRSQVEEIITKYEGAMEEPARENLQKWESWDLSHEDYLLWMEKVGELPKQEPVEEGPAPIDLATVFEAEAQLRMTEEERENIKSGLQSHTSFHDSVSISLTLCGIHRCLHMLSWEVLLGQVETRSPEVAAFLNSRIIPNYVFVKTEVTPFMESTGVLSRNNEDKTIWDLFNSSVKVFKVGPDELEGLRKICQEQQERATELNKRVDEKKVFVAELTKEKGRIQMLVAQRGDLERCVKKAFTDRKKVRKATCAEKPVEMVAPNVLGGTTLTN
jgi:hypothetical protein